MFTKYNQTWAERIKKRNRLGFSLVELIVVVAIMAIMTAVLAPSLLAYVERSRAQRDNSAMSEVVNAVHLALADQDVYDEVLCYTCDNIRSCYVDNQDENGNPAGPDDANRVETKNYGSDPGEYEEGDHYVYNDNERLGDESGYSFHGLMRGVTITFEPERSSNKSAFVLYNGYINAAGHATGTGLNYIDGSCPETEMTSSAMVESGYTEDMMLLGNMHSFDEPDSHYLYNRIRATVGDRIELISQTYRNSTYTIFIRMGTTGGNQFDAQDAIKVYGQWGGTNLSASEVGQGGGSNNIDVPGNQHGLYYNMPYVADVESGGNIIKVAFVFYEDGTVMMFDDKSADDMFGVESDELFGYMNIAFTYDSNTRVATNAEGWTYQFVGDGKTAVLNSNGNFAILDGVTLVAQGTEHGVYYGYEYVSQDGTTMVFDKNGNASYTPISGAMTITDIEWLFHEHCFDNEKCVAMVSIDGETLVMKNKPNGPAIIFERGEKANILLIVDQPLGPSKDHAIVIPYERDDNTGDLSFVISGTVVADAGLRSLTVNGAPVDVKADGSWQTIVPEGNESELEVVVLAVDEQGNSVSVSGWISSGR